MHLLSRDCHIISSFVLSPFSSHTSHIFWRFWRVPFHMIILHLSPASSSLRHEAAFNQTLLRWRQATKATSNKRREQTKNNGKTHNTLTMLCTRFLLLLCTILVQHSLGYFYNPSLEEKEIEVATNPHVPLQDAATEPGCTVQHLLSPHLLITNTLPTQQDTFLRIRNAKVFTQPVPVYSMQQPARLNPGQLQFDIVLVRDLASHSNVYETPVSPHASTDSWFPGYSWTPIVHYCSSQEGGYKHVGWKFVGSSGDKFYALLVNVDERRQKNPIAVGGFKAANWMMNALTK